MSREIDVDELLDMIKTGKIEEYLEEISEGEEPEWEDDLSSIRWIKNNIHIKPNQKEKMKEAIFSDEYDPDIMSYFEAALLEKNEIKTLINGKNGLRNSIYTLFIKATGDIGEYLTDDKIEELGLDSDQIYELIEETGKIEKYLTTGDVKKWGLNPNQIFSLIKKTGNIKKYLTKEKREEFGLDSNQIIELIEETGKIEDYLTENKMQELGLDSINMCNLIKATGKTEIIKKYLTQNRINEFRLNQIDIYELIEATGEIEEYLTEGKVQQLGLDSYSIGILIKKTGKIADYLTGDKVQQLGLDSQTIRKLIIATGEIDKYLTKEKVAEMGLDLGAINELIKATGKTKIMNEYLTKNKINELQLSLQAICDLIKSTGEIDKYLTKEKKTELGLNFESICELIEETGKIDNYLTEHKKLELGLRSSEISRLIKATGRIDEYLTIEKIQQLGLNSQTICGLIKATGKIDEYLTKEKMAKLGLSSYEICDLIKTTGKIDEYLTKEKVAELGLTSKIVLKLVKDNLNENNIHCLYDLGFDHTIIEDVDFLYKNLDYILERENRTEKKQIIERMYEKNNDIIKTKFEILDNKYLQILGENRINQISCYPERVDDILTLNEKELKLLGRCLDLYESEDWTPLCKRILDNIGTYTKLLETIDNIDEMQSEDIEDLTTVLLHENYLDIECIEDVKNFESIKQKKCIEMFKSGDIDDKINAICISKFGQPKSEILQFIEKYADGIDYIEDEDLQYYIKSVVEVLSIEDTEILNNIFKNVEPVKNVNSIAMERNLRNEYGKLYNKGLFTIDQAQKCENLGDNIYEVPIDENGNIANFNMIITSIAPFVANSPDNFCKDWNRPALASQHFCANYIRRDMLGRAPMPHLCYGFSDMKEESLTLSGSCDIHSSGAEFVSYARHGERYLPPDQQINKTVRYNEMDFRRIQGGEKRQPDYIVVFRKDGRISNIDKAQMASEQFGEATGKKLPIVIIDEDKCLETESRLVGDMIENFNNSPSREKAELICQKIRNNRVRNSSFSSDIDISYIQEYSEKNNNEPTVTINEFEQCFAETKPEEREGMVQKFKSFYKALSKEQGKEVARNNEEKSR